MKIAGVFISVILIRIVTQHPVQNEDVKFVTHCNLCHKAKFRDLMAARHDWVRSYMSTEYKRYIVCEWFTETK